MEHLNLLCVVIRSNIEGLGNVLRKFDDRIKEIERKNLKLQGGENIRITQTGTTVIINADPAGDSSSPVASKTCTFVFSKFDIVIPPADSNGVPSTEPTTFKVKSLGGTINGLIPDNFNNIVGFDDQTDVFVTLDAQIGSTGIETLSYNIHSDVPDIVPQYGEGLPPSEYRVLAFVVMKGNITSSLCPSLFISPEVAYLDQSTDPFVPMMTWSVTNAD